MKTLTAILAAAFLAAVSIPASAASISTSRSNIRHGGIAASGVNVPWVREGKRDKHPTASVNTTRSNIRHGRTAIPKTGDKKRQEFPVGTKSK